MTRKQPWVHSALFDSLLITGPGVFSALLVLLFFRNPDQQEISPWLWLGTVLAVDVAHVYSSLYRTYFDEKEFRNHQTLLTLVPVGVLVVGVLVYSLGALYFWRLMAYMAVFHFVRQQYGFLAIYTRNELASWGKTLEKLLIYMCPLYPLIYWHTHPRDFQWFLAGDFFQIPWVGVERVAWFCFLILIALHILKEGRQWIEQRTLNVPKNLLILATGLSWYVGIVLINGDLAFTVTNVLTHGIPYMALVWVYSQRAFTPVPAIAKLAEGFGGVLRSTPFKVLGFYGLLLVLAYFEEGFWDSMVWRDHASLFSVFQWMPKVTEPAWLSLLVPLLAVPQVTHYVIDGFIWKMKGKSSGWKKRVVS